MQRAERINKPVIVCPIKVGKIQVSFELWGIVRSLQRLPHCP
jgi:hypothetical protein